MKLKQTSALLKAFLTAPLSSIQVSGPGDEVKGRWLGNTFVPVSQSNAAAHWADEIQFLSKMFPDSNLLVSSGHRSAHGGPRATSDSHTLGHSLDVAVMATKSRATNSDMKSPRLDENAAVLHHLANNWPSDFPSIFAESDHFHMDTSFPNGVYAAHNYRDGVYKGDKHRSESPLNQAVFKIGRDGSANRVTMNRVKNAQGFAALSGTRKMAHKVDFFKSAARHPNLKAAFGEHLHKFLT